ncbi:MAG: tetratricopeptide repeat protein [Bacteroidales bacterium]|nr:tetratricopeptide repeat protein [Bacteroidales bacterium]
MKKIIMFFVGLCFLQANSLNAQSRTVDSIQQLLQNEKQDTTRVMLLNELSWLYFLNKPDTALILSQQALVLSSQTGFVEGEANSLDRIGSVFTYTGNYSKALEFHLKALKTAESVNDEKTMTSALANIGNDYSSIGNYREAVNYYLQGLAIARRIKYNRGILICLGNLGDAYEKLDILDSARMNTIQFYDIATKMNSKANVGIALSNLGNIYSKMGQNAVAMANFHLSIPWFLQEDDYDGLAASYLGLAELFRESDTADSALYYAKLSLKYGEKAGFTARIMNASNFLTDYYISIHNVDSAFAYQSATIAAKDSLFSQERQREIHSLTFDETMRQQNLALLKAAEEKKRSHNIQFALIAVAIVIFIIVFLLLSQTIIVNEKWIRFLGVMGLLLFFEFLNLFMHPYIARLTQHSPFYTLLVMVLIASLLIPFHHRIDYWIKEKMVAKNKKLRLAAAKRTVAQLEKEEVNLIG